MGKNPEVEGKEKRQKWIGMYEAKGCGGFDQP
jgi:hypothetical protein